MRSRFALAFYEMQQLSVISSEDTNAVEVSTLKTSEPDLAERRPGRLRRAISGRSSDRVHAWSATAARLGGPTSSTVHGYTIAQKVFGCARFSRSSV